MSWEGYVISLAVLDYVLTVFIGIKVWEFLVGWLTSGAWFTDSFTKS